MFLKAVKGLLYLCLGIFLVRFLRDPLKAILVGLVAIALVEVIQQKIIYK